MLHAMGTEIERKFLVKPGWPRPAGGTFLSQGYVSLAPERTVRVRVAGDRAFLTLKGKTQGLARSEFEYEIPVPDAREILRELCELPPVEKTRHELPHAGHLWEVDVFHGANDGLVLAEVELARADEPLQLPDWIGEEVSGDPRYYNASLARTPFSAWGRGGG
jgi:adenylate cyclase